MNDNTKTWRRFATYSRILAEALEERRFPVAEIEAQERRATRMEEATARAEAEANQTEDK